MYRAGVMQGDDLCTLHNRVALRLQYCLGTCHEKRTLVRVDKGRGVEIGGVAESTRVDLITMNVCRESDRKQRVAPPTTDHTKCTETRVREAS